MSALGRFARFADATHAYRAGVLTGLLLKWTAAMEPGAVVSPSVNEAGDYLNRISIKVGEHEFVVALMPQEEDT